MRIKKKYIPLLIMVALLCATSTYGQKPLTKPEKSQTYSPSSEKKVSVEKDKTQTTNRETETIPNYIVSRRAVYDAMSEKYDMGSWDEFNKKMDSEKNRRAVYDTMSERYDMGGWDKFNAKTAQPKEK